jgi:glyoxylase-like metal-dependent hydrolase (beta-lactamase superfamily II)
MKIRMISLALIALLADVSVAGVLEDKKWIHGSADCDSNRDPAVEVFQFDAATYVLRQNKCVHFEAPFMYVLFGEHTVFVQDTGATEEPERFPVYEAVQKLIAQQGRSPTAAPFHVLVTHSHSHGDHTAGDAQFRGKPGVTLIEPIADAVRKHFGFAQWPTGLAKVDLGGRELLVMPAPGHQDESVVVYDPQTKWLLTGDTVLPGQLYVRDWDVYKTSIGRLVEFSKTHPIWALMGTHIEMSREGVIYPRGSTFQPEEIALPLTVQDLTQLDEKLRQAGSEPTDIPMSKFVVAPISGFQRAIGDFLKWITGG